jgi:hypothetical protein
VPALNPFDPEQIDLQAIVDYTTSEGVYVIVCPDFGLKTYFMKILND